MKRAAYLALRNWRGSSLLDDSATSAEFHKTLHAIRGRMDAFDCLPENLRTAVNGASTRLDCCHLLKLLDDGWSEAQILMSLKVKEDNSMSHPMQEHREHHKERERVSRLYGEHEGHRDYGQVYHRARGGKVEHHDEAEDKAVVRSMVKGAALKESGHKSHHRADKRARGGKVKHKGKTIVNVNVAPQQPPQHPPIVMPPHPPMAPPAGAMPPAPPAGAMPPRPPMAGAPGAPPLGPRAMGGRAYATGGPVFSEKIAKMGPTGSGSGHGAKVKTPKNAIYSSARGDMSPRFDGGSGGGVAKKEMAHRAAKTYAKTPPAVHTPGMRND